MVTPSVILIVIDLELVQNTPRTEGGIRGSNSPFNLTVGLRASLLNTMRDTPLNRLCIVLPNIGRPHLRTAYYYDDTFLISICLLSSATAVFLVCLIPHIGNGPAAEAQGRYKRLSLNLLFTLPSSFLFTLSSLLPTLHFVV